MAYEGDITYMDIPYGQVERNNTIYSHIADGLHNGLEDSREPANALSAELKARARKFSLDDTTRQALIFDQHDIWDITD